MGSRPDACQGASAFALGVRELVMERLPRSVATVGNMIFEPGAFNVVPQSVTVFLEFRADDNTTLDAMEEALLARASAEADRLGLRTDVEPVERGTPVRMDADVRESIAQVCDRLGLSHADLPSGADHDAQVRAPVCPTGMIFVPSVEG
jgi:N-carbamoyl-L-amino-acid hydrolase